MITAGRGISKQIIGSKKIKKNRRSRRRFGFVWIASPGLPRPAKSAGLAMTAF